MSLYYIGDVFYDCASVSYLNKLQTLQHRALRVIFYLSSRHNTDELDNMLNLLKLETRITLHLIQIAHWMSQQSMYVDQRLLPTRADATGRKMINLEVLRREIYRKLFRYNSAKYWNNLPTCIHELTLTDRDKALLKKLSL